MKSAQILIPVGTIVPKTPPALSFFHVLWGLPDSFGQLHHYRIVFGVN